MFVERISPNCSFYTEEIAPPWFKHVVLHSVCHRVSAFFSLPERAVPFWNPRGTAVPWRTNWRNSNGNSSKTDAFRKIWFCDRSGSCLLMSKTRFLSCTFECSSAKNIKLFFEHPPVPTRIFRSFAVLDAKSTVLKQKPQFSMRRLLFLKPEQLSLLQESPCFYQNESCVFVAVSNRRWNTSGSPLFQRNL